MTGNIKLAPFDCPRGGDKNSTDDEFIAALESLLQADIRDGNIPKPQSAPSIPSDLKLRKKSGLIYSPYLLPLVCDCSTPKCPNGCSATGFAMLDSNASIWYIQYNCVHDGYALEGSRAITPMIDLILATPGAFVELYE